MLVNHITIHAELAYEHELLTNTTKDLLRMLGKEPSTETIVKMSVMCLPSFFLFLSLSLTLPLSLLPPLLPPPPLPLPPPTGGA